MKALGILAFMAFADVKVCSAAPYLTTVKAFKACWRVNLQSDVCPEFQPETRNLDR